ncbi:hypothetical protein BD770DRAFT_380966 [Pilaira anomala]|nr:hypothetical protein BD770DRAFT_380966 [Pilaira anomala]
MPLEPISFSTVQDLSGKVAVVTGGSRGIGKAIADELIQKGAKVVIGDILESLGNQVVNEYNEIAGEKVAAFIRTDVTKYSDNQALFQLAETEFGGVDIAILNAGIIRNSNTFFSAMEDELEEDIFNVNSIAVVKGSKVALLHMAKRGGGSIVCVASIAGLYSTPDFGAYHSSKYAVVGYVRSCTTMPLVCNVRVNAVCPGWIDTDLLDGVKPSNGFGAYFAEMVKSSPRSKISEVVQGVFTFLAEESRNAETMAILPDGPQIHIPEPMPAGVLDEKSLSMMESYLETAIPETKQMLAEALARYDFGGQHKQSPCTPA